jgi:hypothetical protein
METIVEAAAAVTTRDKLRLAAYLLDVMGADRGVVDPEGTGASWTGRRTRLQ